MAKRKRPNSKVWAKRVQRVLKKGTRRVWKIVRLFTRRLVRVGRAMWRAAFPRKRRRRRAASQPAPARSVQLHHSRHVPTAMVKRRQRVLPFWLFAILPILSLTVATIAFWPSKPRETACVLRDRIDIPEIQKDWPAVWQWCPLIMRAADRYQLDPNLIAALILVESGGDPQAYSSYGAVGLMQVEPRDGIAASITCPNGPCFADRPTIAQLQDPAFNVDYGAMLLRSYVDRYGSLREALRAYGPRGEGYYYAELVLATYERIKP